MNIFFTLWPTNRCKPQCIWVIGGGDTDATNFMGILASFSSSELLGGMILPTGHKIWLFLGNFLPCMYLVISRFVHLEVQLSIFMRQRQFSYSNDITFLFEKMGNCTGVVKSWEELVTPSTLEGKG